MGGSDEYLLRENFKMIDADNSGIISPTELQRALGSHGLLFSLQTISLLIKLHSTRGTGTLDFSEYVSLNNFLEKTQSEFAKFDVNKDGKLGKAEVFRALSSMSFGECDSRAIEEACKSFDPSRENKIGVPEFIALVLFLTSAKKVFEQFDVAKTNSVTLDMNQFIFAASRTRWEV